MQKSKSTNSRSLLTGTGYFIAVLVIGLLAESTSFGDTTYPYNSGSGTFTFDGSTLTLNNCAINLIMYSPSEFAMFSTTDPVVGAVLALSGVTQIGETYEFADGTFTLTVGTETLLWGDIIDTLVQPSSASTAGVNPTPGDINLVNVWIDEDAVGESRFVTDWISAVPSTQSGSGCGILTLSLANTQTGEDGGSFSPSPMVGPMSGPASFFLEPAVPEPACMVLLLCGCAGLQAIRRRR